MDASPDNRPITTGTALGGRYRLERRIAAGGMATVWEAHDEILDRRVAVKVLHPHLAADEQFVARFKREAVAAARLAHQSIVAIYDTCSELGTEAIVMELVRGTTLRAELDRRGRFAPAEAARIVAEVADALTAAHAAGLVHRDVKPANVLLSGDGRVLVADFGIAKAGDGLDLTGTGTTLGTAKYLAPEQVDPSVGPVDARADVYAAGVILYELLCGTPPFTADSEAGTAFARLHRDPRRPTELVPELDQAMEDVVLRALARDPAARFGSAASFRDAVLDAARGISPASGPPTAPVPPVAPVDGATTVLATDGTRVVAPRTTATPTPEPGPPATPKPKPKRRHTGAIVTWSIIVVALAVAGVLWATIGDDGDRGGGGDASSTTPAAQGGGIAVAAVHSFDPDGDGEENDGDAALVADGDAGTRWRTECYTTAAFGNLKPGVGLVVDLGAPSTVRELRVDSPQTGWTAEAFVAGQAGSDLGAWGQPVADVTASGPTTSLSLGGAEGRFVLLWFTGLGDAPSPDCSGRPFGVSVSELAVV